MTGLRDVTRDALDDLLELATAHLLELRYYDAHLDRELHRIYESGYWIPPRCELLGRGLDLVQFDTAVNMGPGRAVRFLQKAAGCGVDGDFGAQTEKAVRACTPGDLIAGYCATREAYYRELARRNPDTAVFLKGWLNRLNALRHEVGEGGLAESRGPGQ